MITNNQKWPIEMGQSEMAYSNISILLCKESVEFRYVEPSAKPRFGTRENWEREMEKEEDWCL